MLEITNISLGPVQIMVRSTVGAHGKSTPVAFSTINIPGKGSGNNVIRIPDEKVTDQIYKIAGNTKHKLIKTRYLVS